ncbi:hypothetical protein DFP73DRAFT_491173, partial [Morchella snyderi]
MKLTISLTFLLTLVSARTPTTQKPRRSAVTYRTLGRREVPQEHSHEKFLTLTGTALNLDNPDEIADPVFGLLGNAAAIKGAGKITDADCLQQATADQAFTNAKAAGDVNGMVAALVYRTLERNTGSVGLASVPCTSITPVNPEIAALTQHQDPASAGAAATNKAIALELAVQIDSVGGDPEVALQSGTFAPGKIGDPTGAGNTCDTLDDPEGCIFTENLLVEDATAAEIAKAVAAGSGAAVVGEDAAAGNGTAVDAGAGAAAGNGTGAAGGDAAAGDGA